MVRSAVAGGVAPPCFRSTELSHSISLQWQASLHPPAATNANADLDCGEAMVISVYLVPQRSRSLPICLTSSNQSRWNTGDVGLELWNRNNGKYCHPVSLPSHFHSNSLSEQVALILTSTMWWWDLLKTQSYFLFQHIFIRLIYQSSHSRRTLKSNMMPALFIPTNSNTNGSPLVNHQPNLSPPL